MINTNTPVESIGFIMSRVWDEWYFHQFISRGSLLHVPRCFKSECRPWFLHTHTQTRMISWYMYLHVNTWAYTQTCIIIGTYIYLFLYLYMYIFIYIYIYIQISFVIGMYSGKYQEIMGSHFPVAIAPRGDCSPHPNPRGHLPLEARFAAYGGFWTPKNGDFLENLLGI